MEEAGTRKALESVNRELCRCPRDLLPWQRRRGLSHDAEHDDEAEVDGERKEDAGLQAAGREVRLSRVYVRALLLDAQGPSLSRHGTLEETSTAYLSRYQRRNRTS